MFNKIEQAAEPDRQPDRRDHAHRGQRDFQRRIARRRHGARQRRAVADQPGTLVVSADARIDGEVQAAHIVVNGTINGPVHATETLELQAGSRVKGDVHYKTIEIHQGAVVEGRLVHHRRRDEGRRAQARVGESGVK